MAWNSTGRRSFGALGALTATRAGAFDFGFGAGVAAVTDLAKTGVEMYKAHEAADAAQREASSRADAAVAADAAAALAAARAAVTKSAADKAAAAAAAAIQAAAAAGLDATAQRRRAEAAAAALADAHQKLARYPKDPLSKALTAAWAASPVLRGGAVPGKSAVPSKEPAPPRRDAGDDGRVVSGVRPRRLGFLAWIKRVLGIEDAVSVWRVT